MADTHTRAALRREIERATQERDELTVVIAYLQKRYDALAPADTPKANAAPSRRQSRAKSTRVLPLRTSLEALAEHGSPMRTADLADVIRSKGAKVTSLENLYRSLKRGKGIERVGRGLWGLSEWYPNGVPSEDTWRDNGHSESVEAGSPLSRASSLESQD